MPTSSRLVVVQGVLFVVACGPKQGASAPAQPAPVEAVTVGAVWYGPPPSPPPEPEPEPPPRDDEPPPSPPPDPVRLAEAAACVRASKISLCLPLFGRTMEERASMDEGAECTRSCIGARDERLKPAVDRATKVCVEAIVKSGGRASASCVFPKFPPPRDPRERSMRFQDALRAAVEKRDAASARALDKVVEELDSKYFAEVEPECTRRCREESAGKTRPKKP